MPANYLRDVSVTYSKHGDNANLCTYIITYSQNDNDDNINTLCVTYLQLQAINQSTSVIRIHKTP
jgi:hypothetical protein